LPILNREYILLLMPHIKSYTQNVKILDLERTSIKIREEVVKMLVEAGSGHSASALGTADIFSALYFHILNIDPQNLDKKDRDRFILSNGHICPVWYTALALRGYFSKEELGKLRKFGSKLQGHPHKSSLPGIENSSGPLGQGLSLAIGIAQALKMDNSSSRVYCMTSDGELNEGQVWEAAMLTPKLHLNNLTWIIDRNNIQIDGTTEQILPLEPLRDKLESFNWYVLEIDGHNVEEIINACNMAKAVGQRPSAIIAHTIPGKGVEFMQYKFDWHGKVPNTLEAKKALKELRTLEGRINAQYD
jgi:transketolase